MSARWLTIQDAADIAAVSTKTIRRRLRDGSLRGAMVGGQWRIRQEDLERFFHARANVRVTR